MASAGELRNPAPLAACPEANPAVFAQPLLLQSLVGPRGGNTYRQSYDGYATPASCGVRTVAKTARRSYTARGYRRVYWTAEGLTMPIHDWTRVHASLFQNFQLGWVAEICRRLNQGVLSPTHYALSETLELGPPSPFSVLPEPD